ncbi:SGNH/GDSL hydrolase family protein [Litoreibacter janthinus]|uniref:Lysophospholipase L1 n=1 Tax=Litoreibacter janthinus TaxID=670154 RepID=A0A1I6H147_9RHOB|nr:SGNH/GDSL hydrolase family protein [Litoreibacter janthinus]SFR48158.1 Lysophospholipase L1 [Litoreibacter janthinus]
MNLYFRQQLMAACLVLAASIPSYAQGKEDILVIGDSMLEWQSIRGASIPQVLQKRTRRSVENRAASGAKLYLTGATGKARSVIPTQYTKGDWNWVVVNGGANDLLAKCGCNQCDGVLDRLITKDAKAGVLPDLAAQIRKDGPKVILLAYYQGNKRPNLFSRCEQVVKELTERQRRLAERMKGVEFVRTKAAIDPSNRSHFALDGIHLSRKGTRRVGALLAKALEQLEKNQR